MPAARLALCLLVLGAVAPAPAARAAVLLPPIEGTAASAGEVLRTGDGRELTPRQHGDTLLVRGDDGFAVHERRRGGAITGAAVHVNAVDRISVDVGGAVPVVHLNGVEWNPKDETTYLLPRGGTIRFAAGRFPVTFTSPAGDRVVVDRPGAGLTLTLTAGDGLLEGSRDGLLAFDAGTATADDLVDRDGAPVDDAATALRSWALRAGESLIGRSSGTCAVALGDGIGKDWLLEDDGDARAGQPGNLTGGALLQRSDRAPITAGLAACSTEMDGREVVAPLSAEPQTVPAGVRLVRKTLVTAEGPPFVRHLTVLRNTTAAPVTLTLIQRFDRTDGSPVGAVTATSTGDAAAGVADGWMASAIARAARFDPGYFATGVVWQDAEARADGADAVLDLDDVPAPADPAAVTPAPAPFADGDRAFGVVFGDVRLEPREQAAYLTAQLADDHIPGAEARLAALAAAPADLFAGLSARERRSLRNWRPVGDADGDGRDDLDDACPDEAAATPDGCVPPPEEPRPGTPAPEVRTSVVGMPVPVPVPVPVVPATAPRPAPRAVTASARRAGTRLTVTGRVTRPAGMTAACGGFAEVIARAGRRGAAVRRYVPVSAACRFRVTVGLPAGWARRAVTVRARFLGSDRLRPRAARTVRVAQNALVSASG